MRPIDADALLKKTINNPLHAPYIVEKDIRGMPTIQPEPSIPLSWIDEYIEWLKSFDNEFANLEAAHISVMLKKWRNEQDE